uniref:Uncharacterized protein n=1 Tax=Oryza glumipatula TaxID=40148 RepID=A0A0D9YBX0_9ORYZ
MKVLRLLAARRFRRRAVSTITATAPATPCGGGGWYGEDEGPFFDLDLSCCSASAPASSAESGSESEDYSSCAGESDFVISLQRSRSASPSYEERVFYVGGGSGWARAAAPAHLKFCASEPSDAASRYGSGRRGKLRTLSFGSAKAAFYGGRASFSRSSNSARSARLFAAFGYGSPDQGDEANRRTPSRDVIRRYLSKISRQLRRVAPSAGADLRLRKSRSASAAQTAACQSPPPRRDDSLLEQQDGIASAIAHCKESLHRVRLAIAAVTERSTKLAVPIGFEFSRRSRGLRRSFALNFAEEGEMKKKKKKTREPSSTNCLLKASRKENAVVQRAREFSFINLSSSLVRVSELSSFFCVVLGAGKEFLLGSFSHSPPHVQAWSCQLCMSLVVTPLFHILLLATRPVIRHLKSTAFFSLTRSNRVPHARFLRT